LQYISLSEKVSSMMFGGREMQGRPSSG
jgi:hypothetical protein